MSWKSSLTNIQFQFVALSSLSMFGKEPLRCQPRLPVEMAELGLQLWAAAFRWPLCNYVSKVIPKLNILDTRAWRCIKALCPFPAVYPQCPCVQDLLAAASITVHFIGTPP
ncbi:hypothetical protein SKAU_G00402860 [Synaphobranchus kaupii]|uniref:Uncharacterized protein n=1 Tax=Synaphobranchus kaupii TaxID=118154 RepID=A0A9Q1E9E1_SYNKA|nr:hypothetical protein SKAU_G00402860 [Synaphobranchus kaupii]